AGVAFAVGGDGVGFATESYAASALYPSGALLRIRRVSSVFELARKEWGYTALPNPLIGIKKPKDPEGRDRRLRVGELEALMKACRDKTSGLWLRQAIQLAIETALRRGELLGIRWSDVDFNGCLLHVPFTKTGKSRTIPLTERAVDILQELKASSTNADIAFPISPNGFRLAWERCKRRAQKAGCPSISELRFHDLRHEAVSRFFEMGLNTVEVALISGHRDLRMLFRYTHLRAEDVGVKMRSNPR
ncbi:site-specific integrase, partial [Bradyrhizobium sp. Mp27]|uniref:site-specific integrase n=1 Tax=Bradyrhizobium sp. Mp27 TaxID=3042157 RepID=UPI00248C91AD